jgi:hypothetical protein
VKRDEGIQIELRSVCEEAKREGRQVEVETYGTRIYVGKVLATSRGVVRLAVDGATVCIPIDVIITVTDLGAPEGQS